MVQLSLFASHPQQGLPRLPQLLDCEPFLLGPGSSQYVRKPALLAMRPHDLHQIQTWKLPTSGSLKNNQNDSSGRNVLSDVKDTHPDSILFSIRIAKQCTRQKEILEFLRYVSSEVERGGPDMSPLTGLMGLEVTADEMFRHQLAPKYGLYFQDAVCQPTLLFPSREICSEKPLVDMVGNLDYNSDLVFYFDGQVAGDRRIETMDILSIIAELNLPNDSKKWRNQSMLVPHFEWSKSSEAIHGSLNVKTTNVVPLKSPRKTRLRSLPKKKSHQKAGQKRELYRKSYFHSFETLLSIILDNRRHAKTAILELKRSSPELTTLLTQFSATIAGTGIALIFSVLYKVASGRVPLCTSRLLNTGLGLGLVWLSWAVNGMRDTISCINRNSRKLAEEDMLRNLDTSVRQVYYRAATLMVLVMIRLA
ncbi:GTP binding Elongation factor Tu family protein [Heracleum sosnowskyi]|uniref:GTP binding Elongation factor Tu family protein n=1 Tax=Heracleum sosnowskyi TaxID=360622 RepID=A0AAD8GVF6_9APIA|nr:GTP binding Elongation factor Tu family protein [Heracleum sosnowskyi]